MGTPSKKVEKSIVQKKQEEKIVEEDANVVHPDIDPTQSTQDSTNVSSQEDSVQTQSAASVAEGSVHDDKVVTGHSVGGVPVMTKVSELGKQPGIQEAFQSLKVRSVAERDIEIISSNGSQRKALQQKRYGLVIQQQMIPTSGPRALLTGPHTGVLKSYIVQAAKSLPEEDYQSQQSLFSNGTTQGSNVSKGDTQEIPNGQEIKLGLRGGGEYIVQGIIGSGDGHVPIEVPQDTQDSIKYPQFVSLGEKDELDWDCSDEDRDMLIRVYGTTDLDDIPNVSKKITIHRVQSSHTLLSFKDSEGAQFWRMPARVRQTGEVVFVDLPQVISNPLAVFRDCHDLVPYFATSKFRNLSLFSVSEGKFQYQLFQHVIKRMLIGQGMVSVRRNVNSLSRNRKIFNTWTFINGVVDIIVQTFRT